MPIEDRNMEPGTVLTARYKKQERTCEVVKTDDGLRYRLDDGTMHKSPSSAGKTVIGHACNGWVFWSVEGTEKPKREPKAKADKPKKEPAAKKPAPKKPAKTKTAKPKTAKPKKSKAMRTAANGESYGCGVCPETFPSLEDAQAHVASVHAEPERRE